MQTETGGEPFAVDGWAGVRFRAVPAPFCGLPVNVGTVDILHDSIFWGAVGSVGCIVAADAGSVPSFRVP